MQLIQSRNSPHQVIHKVTATAYPVPGRSCKSPVLVCEKEPNEFVNLTYLVTLLLVVPLVQFKFYFWCQPVLRMEALTGPKEKC